MSLTLVIADGGVASLVACAVAGQRAATGPVGASIACLLPSLPEDDPRVAAAVAHANQFGLSAVSVRNPIDGPGGAVGRECRVLLEAGASVTDHGGGEVVWPVMVPESGEGPDVAALAMVMNRALLMSQLFTLSAGGPPVRFRAPYADLTERQLADLVLDMDLPVWTCWWMSASEHATGELRDAAVHERLKWTRLLKEAGWSGSLEAKAVVRPVAVPPSGQSKQTGVRT